MGAANSPRQRARKYAGGAFFVREMCCLLTPRGQSAAAARNGNATRRVHREAPGSSNVTASGLSSPHRVDQTNNQDNTKDQGPHTNTVVDGVAMEHDTLEQQLLKLLEASSRVEFEGRGASQEGVEGEKSRMLGGVAAYHAHQSSPWDACIRDDLGYRGTATATRWRGGRNVAIIRRREATFNPFRGG
ncbi:hypothetical protein B7463_g7408, partial [Scytalidium lignicola]